MKYWEPIYSRVFGLPCTLTFHFLILRILELSTRFSILNWGCNIFISFLCIEHHNSSSMQGNCRFDLHQNTKINWRNALLLFIKENIWHEIAAKHRLMHKFFRNYQGKHFWLNFLHLVNWFHIQGILHYHTMEFFFF